MVEEKKTIRSVDILAADCVALLSTYDETVTLSYIGCAPYNNHMPQRDITIGQSEAICFEFELANFERIEYKSMENKDGIGYQEVVYMYIFNGTVLARSIKSNNLHFDRKLIDRRKPLNSISK